MRYILLTILSVTLMSFSAGKAAKMKIVIVDENSSIVVGAKVIVFATHADYENEVNPVTKGETNSKGFIQFKGLKEQKYYLIVSKDGKNNHNTHNETDVLRLKGKNRFEIMID